MINNTQSNKVCKLKMIATNRFDECSACFARKFASVMTGRVSLALTVLVPTSDRLERLVSEMTYNVLMGMVKSLTAMFLCV